VEVKTRKEATLAGESKYFTGVPCKDGHVSERYVKNSTCVECIRTKTRSRKEYYRKYRKENKEKYNRKGSEWYHSNREYILELAKLKRREATAEDRELERNKQEEYKKTPMGRGRSLAGGASARAKEKGLPYDLTPTWVAERLQVGLCEVSGIPFVLDGLNGENKRHPFTPSLDRIDSTKGYTRDNVLVVCWIVNSFKNEYGYDVVKYVAEKIIEHGVV